MEYLYLHGLGQNANSWNAVTSAVKVLGESICLDFYGMIDGESATYSNLYNRFSNKCNVEHKDIVLCGLSLGGVLALNYALEYPDKVKALVLIAAQYKMPKRILKMQNIIFHLMPQTKFQQTGFNKYDFISLCSTMAEIDFSNSLTQISCPSLIVCGEKDKVNKKASVELSKILKHSMFKELPGVGHEVNTESPDKLASLLQEFYNNIGFGSIVERDLCAGQSSQKLQKK